MDLQSWREARRLHKTIFPGPTLNQFGMVLGALTATLCVWDEMERHRGWIAVLIGALVAWGAYGAYTITSALKWRHDEYKRQLQELEHAPR